ncbi:metalloprotease [Clostridium fermenticellae]|uniref:Metalloprotease n=1 Tax=Clostridium fermenticellae TaxID=2068654 RepID=A0A386H620_9CLOT|nr:site-2 protease family protein [Clostridium fermenticellae]AYD41018.1 metalloprotease [Clostridium fermenticellae]
MIKFNRYFIPYIIFLFIIGYKGHIIYAVLIVMSHEIVHYIFARIYGFYGLGIEFKPVGTSLNFKALDDAEPKQDLIISLSGPVFNLIMALIFYFFSKRYHFDQLNILFLGNLAIGIFNLIPGFPLDGGRILRDLLCCRYNYRKSNKIMINISIIIGILLMFFYVLLFFKGFNNFSIGIVGIFIIITSLKENERIPYIIMGDIIKKRYKFMKKGYIENKLVSVYYKKDLLSLMSIFDKNKYNVFIILDDQMKVLDIVYENDIVEGLKIYGNITIEEFLNKSDGNL